MHTQEYRLVTKASTTIWDTGNRCGENVCIAQNYIQYMAKCFQNQSKKRIWAKVFRISGRKISGTGLFLPIFAQLICIVSTGGWLCVELLRRTPNVQTNINVPSNL